MRAIAATVIACAALVAATPASASATPPVTVAQLPGPAGCVSGDDRDVGCTKLQVAPFFATLTITPGGDNLYLTGLGSDAGQVTTLKRDPVSGALSQAGCMTTGGRGGCAAVSALTGARASAVSPDGRNVYTVTNGFAPGTAGALITFSRDATTGDLRQTGCTGNADSCPDRDLAVAGADGVLVAPDGRHVYVAANGRLLTYQRAGDGSVQRVDCIGSDSGCQRDPDLSECRTKPPGACRAEGGFLPGELAFSPEARFLYVGTGRGPAEVFARDPITGSLTPLGCDPRRTACDPPDFYSSGLALARDGRNAYSVLAPRTIEARPALVQSRRDAVGGQLVGTQCVGGQLPGAGCGPTPGLGRLDDVEASPGGGAVYASFGPDRTPSGWGLGVFARDRGDGSLTQTGCVSDTGSEGLCIQAAGLKGASALTISPDGRSIYVSGADGRIAVLGPAVGLSGRVVHFTAAGRARVQLSCPRVARARCTGALKIARPSRVRSAASRRALATRRFSISPGGRATVAVRLSREGKRALRRGKRAKAQLTLLARGRVSGRSLRQITLRRSPAKHRRGAGRRR